MSALVGYRTLIAAAVAFISELASRFGVTIDVDGTTNSIITLAGIAAAVYFKLAANKREAALKKQAADK